MMEDIRDTATMAKCQLNQFTNLIEWYRTFSTEHPQLIQVTKDMININKILATSVKNAKK